MTFDTGELFMPGHFPDEVIVFHAVTRTAKCRSACEVVPGEKHDHGNRPEPGTDAYKFPDMPFYYRIKIRGVSILPAQIFPFEYFCTFY